MAHLPKLGTARWLEHVLESASRHLLGLRSLGRFSRLSRAGEIHLGLNSVPPSQARYGESNILRNQTLASEMSASWRLLIGLMIALLLGLFTAYNV